MHIERRSKECDGELRFDIYRTLVLGHYLRYWGMPEYRMVVHRDDGSKFELYSFPASDKKPMFHVATVGLAEQSKADGSKEGHEFMMALGEDLGGADLDAVFIYLADICAHAIKNLGPAELPRVMGPSALAPAAWPTKALLLDEPRGEAEDFRRLDITPTTGVEFVWLIPIHASEYGLILDEGIDAFDALEQSSEYSIADVNRKPFC